MPIALVQKVVLSNAAVNGVTNTNLTPVIITPGNAVLFSVMDTGGGQIGNLLSSQGDTWIQVPGALESGGGQNLDWWYFQNAVGGSTTITIRLTTNTGSSTDLILFEFSGVSTTAALLPGSGTTFSGNSAPMGVPLTPTATGQLLVTSSTPGSFNYTGMSAPWIGSNAGQFTSAISGYYINPPLSTQQATMTPTTSQNFYSSGAIFQPAPTVLMLTLTDSLSSSDSTVAEDEKTITDSVTPADSLAVARAQNVSDSMTVTDSFSLQSSFVTTPVPPAVEVLVNQLVPADIKTYFTIQE